MNGYMTIKEASEKWDLGIRRINTLCNESRIPECVKCGSVWAIPAETEKPKDKRIKNGKYKKSVQDEHHPVYG